MLSAERSAFLWLLFTTFWQFLGFQTWEFLPGILKMSHPFTWASRSVTQSKWGMVKEKLHKSQVWVELILGEREEWAILMQTKTVGDQCQYISSKRRSSGCRRSAGCWQGTAVPSEEWGSWTVTSVSWRNAPPLQAFQGCLGWEISTYHLFTSMWWLSECVCKLSQFPRRWWCWM